MFNPVETIIRKRSGLALSSCEIKEFIEGYTRGAIPDYQMSALLMAIFIRGFNRDEEWAWTESMLISGKILDLSGIKGAKIDKHSTGGVGDKISIPLAPLVAACGVVVPMVSGRGLGHTGGTLDKLESIPGFRTDITEERFREILDETGVSLIGQTEWIAPADKKIYALRDVTGTVDHVSLIASSIMSKKLAEGISGLLLDVKCGSGAFMKDIGSARLLAQTLVRIGNAMSVGCRAFITNMNQPIGWAVGNALEIKESIEILKGGGPADTLELVVAFGGWMLHAGGKAESEEHGAEMIRDAIADGSGAEIFKRLIKAQGGNPEIVDNPDLMPSAVHEHEFKAEDEGYIESFDAEAMGMALVLLGGGRLKKEDSIDPSVGFRVHKKIGDFAKKGDAIFTVYYNDERKLEDSLAKLKGCVKFSPKNPDFTLILEKFE